MATASCKIGDEITIGTTDTEYTIAEAGLLGNPQEVTVECLSTNSGTIQFSVGETPPVTAHAHAAGEKRVFTVGGSKKLWAKGSGAGQKFVIS